MMCNVYTDVGGIKKLYRVCSSEREVIHSLKLVDYLHLQTDTTWYNYYLKRQSLLIVEMTLEQSKTPYTVYLLHKSDWHQGYKECL